MTDLNVMQSVVDTLTEGGYDAALEYPGYVAVLIGDIRFDFGTVNGTWEADIYDWSDGYERDAVYDTEISEYSTDVAAIVAGIKQGLESYSKLKETT